MYPLEEGSLKSIFIRATDMSQHKTPHEIIKCFHALIMNPNSKRNELKKLVDDHTILSVNAAPDSLLGPTVDTYHGHEGFNKFLDREGKLWSSGACTSFVVKEIHTIPGPALLEWSVVCLTEQSGGRDKEEVLIRSSEVWNIVAGIVQSVKIYATAYPGTFERSPPKMLYLKSGSKAQERAMNVDPNLKDHSGPRVAHFGIHGGDTK